MPTADVKRPLLQEEDDVLVTEDELQELRRDVLRVFGIRRGFGVRIVDFAEETHRYSVICAVLTVPPESLRPPVPERFQLSLVFFAELSPPLRLRRFTSRRAQALTIAE